MRAWTPPPPRPLLHLNTIAMWSSWGNKKEYFIKTRSTARNRFDYYDLQHSSSALSFRLIGRPLPIFLNYPLPPLFRSSRTRLHSHLQPRAAPPDIKSKIRFYGAVSYQSGILPPPTLRRKHISRGAFRDSHSGLVINLYIIPFMGSVYLLNSRDECLCSIQRAYLHVRALFLTLFMFSCNLLKTCNGVRFYVLLLFKNSIIMIRRYIWTPYQDILMWLVISIIYKEMFYLTLKMQGNLTG